MTDGRRTSDPPSGLTKSLFRLPIFFYRIGLGWLLGSRFILVNHIGRKSGQRRQAVLEVVRAERENHTYYVVSAFGEKAQWYQNLMIQPDVDVQVGKHKFEAHAERLSTENATRVLEEYAVVYPTAARTIYQWMGYAGKGSKEDFRNLGESLPVIRFSPR